MKFNLSLVWIGYLEGNPLLRFLIKVFCVTKMISYKVVTDRYELSSRTSFILLYGNVRFENIPLRHPLILVGIVRSHLGRILEPSSPMHRVASGRRAY